MNTNPKNILSNKLLQIGIAAIFCVAFAIWFLWPVNRQKKANINIEATSYSELEKRITEYTKAGRWDADEYNSMNIQADNSLKNKKITSAQKDVLKSLARTRYVITLNDAINNFLKTAGATSAATLNKFELEIDRISSGIEAAKLKDGIVNFRKMMGLKVAVDAYVFNNKFESGTTNNINAQMDAILANNILRTNEYLGRLRTENKNSLYKQKEIAEDYQTAVLPYIKSDSSITKSTCAYYLPYKYYCNDCLDKLKARGF